MGGVSRTLFGAPSKEKSSSESGDTAYPAISGALTPALNYTTQGGDMMANLLGVGGGPAQTDALNNFANSGGMQFVQNQGLNGIASNNAAKGLLQSGSTLQAMDKYNQNLASTYLTQYMGGLDNLSKLGIGAGGIMSDAGRYSNSSGSGTGAKQGLLQTLAGNPGLGQAVGAAVAG